MSCLGDSRTSTPAATTILIYSSMRWSGLGLPGIAPGNPSTIVESGRVSSLGPSWEPGRAGVAAVSNPMDLLGLLSSFTQTSYQSYYTGNKTQLTRTILEEHRVIVSK